MENELYITGEMNKAQAEKFMAEFYEQVGTEHELQEIGAGKYQVLCMEMIAKEINTCRAIETKIMGESA